MSRVTLALADPTTLTLGVDDGPPISMAADLTAVAELIPRYDRAAKLHDTAELPKIGRALHEWLDATFAWMSEIRPHLTAPLLFEVTTPLESTAAHRTLLELPWELLHDGTSFLAANAQLGFVPLRRIGERTQPREPGPLALSVLFMAAAPRGADELDFEVEEARILEQTKDTGLDLFIEESGTAAELAQRAEQLASHVLHLTCHGLNDPRPLLCFEDETGELAWTEVGDLLGVLGKWASELGLLFLSACSTAAGGGFSRTEDSLALAITRAGTRAVLGWAANVIDTAATSFAAMLYEQLGRGVALEFAVAAVRHAMLTDKDNPEPQWHLARLFLGPDGGGVLARSDGQRRKPEQGDVAFLGDERRSRVASPGEFVGRRRKLQDCIRALRRSDAVGVALQGPGQIGKSSLAARIVDRMSDHHCVVEYGTFSGMSLVRKIHAKLGESSKGWFERWESCRDAEISAALGELMLKGQTPLLLVLDDFEQLLDVRVGGGYEVNEDAAVLVAGVLRAFASAANGSRVLITTRHRFVLPSVGGQELVERIDWVRLASFSSADSAKRAWREPKPAQGEDLRSRCATASRNNPAVLGLLLRCMGEPEVCTRVIEQLGRLEETGAEVESDELRALLEHVAARGLLECLSEGDLELFMRSLIVDAPLPIEAASELAQTGEVCDGDAERLFDVGAWEELRDVAGGRAFVASPLVRADGVRWTSESGWLGNDLRVELSRALVGLLRKQWASVREHTRDASCALAGAELVRLARSVGDWQAAAEFGQLFLAWTARVSLPSARGQAQQFIGELWAAEVGLEPMLYYDAAKLHEHGGDGLFRHECLECALALMGPDTKVSLVPWGLLLFERALSHLRRGAIESAEIDVVRLIGDIDNSIPQREQAIFRSVLADIKQLQGELDEAMRILRGDVLPLIEQLDEPHDRATTLWKVADIKQVRGELDEALQILEREVLPVFEHLGAVKERALTMGKMADIREARGELDEALRIRLEEELPVFKWLDDDRSRAVTRGKVADIREARGELDEALRIHLEELPVFERLGAVREWALAMGKVANIREARGELDEALRIRSEEQLPVFARLGDARSRAVTLGKVASIRQSRGELDEALRILKQDVLPVFERLGDVPSRAATLGKMADIKRQLGELDEALRIHLTEELPLLHGLGDVRSTAVAMSGVASIKQARGELNEALRIIEFDVLPAFEQLGDVRSRAIILGKVADIKHERGEFDEAVRILRSEVLPIYERLGDMRSLTVGRTNLAIILAKRGRLAEDGQETVWLLVSALRDARLLALSADVQFISNLIRHLGGNPDAPPFA